MIQRVYAQGFKGLTFDQPLAPHTAIVGRVGSGKSARALALSLAATGTLPGITRNGDILAAVGSGDDLIVGMELIDGTVFERVFKRKSNGTATCCCRINGTATPKGQFEIEVDRRGIHIADVASFLALSDAKKIDELFRLFPPAGDVRGLSADIARTKANISEIEAGIKAKEQSCKSITESLSQAQLPPATLPEIQAEIAKTEREYQEARDEITRERALAEAERNAAHAVAEAVPEQLLLASPVTPESQTSAARPATYEAETAPNRSAATGIAIESLERVLSALERAGCDGCAARMVLRRELKQLRQGA